VAATWHRDSETRAGALEPAENGALLAIPVLATPDATAGEGGGFELQDVRDPDLVDPVSQKSLLETLGFASALVVPLARGVGWLVMGSSQPGYRFSPPERRLYQSLAAQAGMAVRSFQLWDILVSRTERERDLSEVTTRIRETLDMELILQSALRELGQTLGISRIEVRMRGEER